MSYSRIAVAVALQRFIDFTPVVLRARELAIALAQSFQADVDVITVEAPVALLPDTETTQEKLDRYVKGFQEKGIDAGSHLLAGKPSDRIAGLLSALGADLLIIGSHSKRSVLDIGLGSTSSALVQSASCPVLMIWPTREESERTKSLMNPGYPFILPYG